MEFQFDIAVTVEDSKGKEGGIKVASLLTGAVNSETRNSSVSRVTVQMFIHNK